MLTILILWTWGLTPLWVNIVGTVLMGFKIFGSVIKALYDLGKKAEAEEEQQKINKK